jgi:hypothetical protein
MLSKLNQFRKDKQLTDIIITFSDGKSEPVVGHFHKAVLAANSSYFEKMFSGSFNEQNQKEITILESGLNPIVLRDELTGFYGEVLEGDWINSFQQKNSGDEYTKINGIPRWKYLLERVKCRNFLLFPLYQRSSTDNIHGLRYILTKYKCPPEGFDDLLDVAEILNFDEEIVRVLGKNFPANYDLKKIPDDLYDSMIKETRKDYMVSIRFDGEKSYKELAYRQWKEIDKYDGTHPSRLSLTNQKFTGVLIISEGRRGETIKYSHVTNMAPRLICKSANNRYVVIAGPAMENKWIVNISDPFDGILFGEVQIYSEIFYMTYTADHKFLLLIIENAIVVLNGKTAEIVNQFSSKTDFVQIRSLVCNKDNTEIIAIGFDPFDETKEIASKVLFFECNENFKKISECSDDKLPIKIKELNKCLITNVANVIANSDWKSMIFVDSNNNIYSWIDNKYHVTATTTINDINYSKDGSLLAVGLSNKNVSIYDANNMETISNVRNLPYLQEMPSEAIFLEPNFNDDKKVLIGTTTDGYVKVLTVDGFMCTNFYICGHRHALGTVKSIPYQRINPGLIKD